MKHIILASGSPRRKELLQQVHLPFEVRISSCDENITKTSPEEIVMELSDLKASDIASKLSDADKKDCCIIGADTIVANGSKILGKPHNEKEAFSMLESLSDSTHQVYTGVTLIRCEDGMITKKSFYEKTDVIFYPLTPEKIKTYIATGDPMDKAGAYGIQGYAASFVKKIDGCYNNVVGLPVARLLHELEQL